MSLKNEWDFLLDKLKCNGIQVDTFQFEKEILSWNLRTVFVKTIAVLGGFLAMGMLSVFLGITGILDNEYVMLALGGILLIISYVIMKNKDNAISDGLSVSIYITGFFAVVASIAIFNDMMDDLVYFILFLCILGLSMFKNSIVVFLNCIGVYGSLHWIVVSNQVNYLFCFYLLFLVSFCVFLFWNEIKIRTANKQLNFYYSPVLTASFIYSLGMGIISSTDIFFSYYQTDIRIMPYILLAGLLVITLFTIYFILKYLKISDLFSKISVCIAVAVFILLWGHYPAFSVGLIFALWSFQNQFKAGFIMAICTFVWSMGLYYYDLNITLLGKSLYLILTGVLFLLIYWIVHKNRNKYEKK
ncbi:DUF4401 domain-containing protein [Myroides indicus]|uniref:Uncharacterized protein DUF4401 n=1 Tax=Myroides indicus TaxID=1323422 RepID=A0A4R7EYR0_9FLAO|nr:DUF4401 domain-containing protein [Myroides indicus]TDS59608.1 uncharacterized protein DUF4401 [Myroides indicus]